MQGSAVNHVTLWRDMSVNCCIDLETSYKREHEDQVPRRSRKSQPVFAMPASITSVICHDGATIERKAQKQDPRLISPTEPGAYLHMSSSSSSWCTHATQHITVPSATPSSPQIVSTKAVCQPHAQHAKREKRGPRICPESPAVCPQKRTCKWADVGTSFRGGRLFSPFPHGLAHLFRISRPAQG
jgi:hypothetical protein